MVLSYPFLPADIRKNVMQHDPLVPWSQIDTVLLDMDGTLLDLHFDNHFWLEVIPQKLAEKLNQPLAQTKAYMTAECAKVFGQIQWYCLDFWQEKLDLDIVSAKREIQHLITLREDTIPFLDALKNSGREVVLVTNAHRESLSLKVEMTQLDSHITRLISTHDYGVTKESQLLWQALQQDVPFDPQRTLFVDDSIPILHAAKTFGIAHLLCVDNPDSRKPLRGVTEFPSVVDYRNEIPFI
jgi:HAD superfamily hydrolase (TIGR01509 family)